MKKLNVAIIGCGRISVVYDTAFHKLADRVNVVYAVDKDEKKAKEFADKFGCAYATDFEQIENEDIDVLHICLPHYLHAPVAIKAMKAGMNVLTEKPVAMTLQETDMMKRMQEETAKKLGVIFQTRYTTGVQRLKKMIEEGRFGRIISARSMLTWSRTEDYYKSSDWKGTWNGEGGGTLIDQAIHSMDRVRYLVGSDIAWIEGNVSNYTHPYVSVEDTATAAIGFENGCLYSVYATNTYSIDAPIDIELVGEKGRCGLKQDLGYYELNGEYVEIYDEDDEVPVGPNYWGSSHHIQIREFYDEVMNDKDISINVDEGRKTLEMVKGIYLSSAKKERISLPFEDVMYEDLNQIIKK